jgi:hypothetical protein
MFEDMTNASVLGPKKQDFWLKINCNPMKLPNFVIPSADGLPKIRHDFSNKEVQQWKLSKKSFDKKFAPKLVFFIDKNQKIYMILEIENSL